MFVIRGLPFMVTVLGRLRRIQGGENPSSSARGIGKGDATAWRRSALCYDGCRGAKILVATR